MQAKAKELISEAKEFANKNSVIPFNLNEKDLYWFETFSLKLLDLAVEKFNQPVNNFEGVMPCEIIEADFSENTVTLLMKNPDFKVSAGPMYLCSFNPNEVISS